MPQFISQHYLPQNLPAQLAQMTAQRSDQTAEIIKALSNIFGQGMEAFVGKRQAKSKTAAEQKKLETTEAGKTKRKGMGIRSDITRDMMKTGERVSMRPPTGIPFAQPEGFAPAPDAPDIPGLAAMLQSAGVQPGVQDFMTGFRRKKEKVKPKTTVTVDEAMAKRVPGLAVGSDVSASYEATHRRLTKPKKIDSKVEALAVRLSKDNPEFLAAMSMSDVPGARKAWLPTLEVAKQMLDPKRGQEMQNDIDEAKRFMDSGGSEEEALKRLQGKWPVLKKIPRDEKPGYLMGIWNAIRGE